MVAKLTAALGATTQFSVNRRALAQSRGDVVASEQTFFTENGLTVTQARFAVPGGQTFAMSGVTSVGMIETYPEKDKAKKLIIWGIPLILLFFFGVLLIIAGIVWMMTAKPLYTVVLTSASGETSAYSSRDKELVQRIIAAITDAIIARG